MAFSSSKGDTQKTKMGGDLRPEAAIQKLLFIFFRYIVRVQVADLNNPFLEADVIKKGRAFACYSHFLILRYLISKSCKHLLTEIRIFH